MKLQETLLEKDLAELSRIYEQVLFHIDADPEQMLPWVATHIGLPECTPDRVLTTDIDKILPVGVYPEEAHVPLPRKIYDSNTVIFIIGRGTPPSVFDRLASVGADPPKLSAFALFSLLVTYFKSHISNPSSVSLRSGCSHTSLLSIPVEPRQVIHRNLKRFPLETASTLFFPMSEFPQLNRNPIISLLTIPFHQCSRFN